MTVFAASSLTEVFGELARAFERTHPDVEVLLNLAGSQALRLQLEQGAPADVFASANLQHMRALVEAGLTGRTQIFASNALEIVVPATNPAGIKRFEDLPQAKRLVIGAREVPVGRYTRGLLDRAEEELGPAFSRGVRASIVSREANVRLVLAKVELGEADAAIVYRTDAQAAGAKVKRIPIPDALAQQVRYQAAVLRRASRATLAEKWLQWLQSERGREILRRHGFTP